MPEGKAAMLTEFLPRPRLELGLASCSAAAMEDATASHRLFSSASYLYTLPPADGARGEVFPFSMVKIALTSPLTVCIRSGPLTCLQTFACQSKSDEDKKLMWNAALHGAVLVGMSYHGFIPVGQLPKRVGSLDTCSLDGVMLVIGRQICAQYVNLRH